MIVAPFKMGRSQIVGDTAPDALRDERAGGERELLRLCRPELVRQVDPALHAEAEERRPLVDLVHPDHVADGVEVDVARLLDRVAQIH